MTPGSEDISERTWYGRVVVTLALLLSHVLTAFAPRDFWDGALYSALAADGDWPGTYQPFRDAGYPIHGLYHWAVGQLAAHQAGQLHHLIGLLCLWISSLAVYEILRRETGDGALAIMAAGFFASHPVFSFMIGSGGNAPTMASTACFYLGALLLFRFPKPGPWSLLSYPLLIAGFAWRSYPFYYLVLVVILIGRDCGWKPGRAKLISACRAHFLNICLPVVYFVANGILFRQTGNYAVDNTFRGFGAMAKGALLYTAACAPTAVFEAWPAILSVGGVCMTAAALWVARGLAASDRGAERLEQRWLWLLALSLFALGGFPYVFVGKVCTIQVFPWPHFADWTARWFLLGLLPVGLGLVAAARWLEARSGRPGLSLFLVFAIIGANIAQSQALSRRWLQFSLIDDALVAQFRMAAPGAPESWRLIEPPLRPRELKHRGYELSALLRDARGGTVREHFPSDWDDGQQAGRPLGRRPNLLVVGTDELTSPFAGGTILVSAEGLESLSTWQLLTAAMERRFQPWVRTQIVR